MSANELACSYVALILYDDGIPITVGKKELSQLPFKKHRLCSFSPLVWRFGEKGTKVFLRKKDDCHLKVTMFHASYSYIFSLPCYVASVTHKKESRRKRVTGGRSLKRKEIESDEDSSQTFVHAV